MDEDCKLARSRSLEKTKVILKIFKKAFNHRAKMNGLSSKGEWSENLEL